jgi:RND family efflux transporter MFP subunit
MACALLPLVLLAAHPLFADPLAAVAVTVESRQSSLTADGSIEAVRQSVLAAQVSGRVTALTVKAGDSVKAGQLLVRIDQRMAEQQSRAGQSQVDALEAELRAASQEYHRQQRLYDRQLISLAALEQAEAKFKADGARTQAQIALARSAFVQAGLHALHAPYDAVVSRVDVEIGDMAAPGKPLITLYDPTLLRAVVNVPQSEIAGLLPQAVRIEIPAAPPESADLKIDGMTVLPTADPVSQKVQIRVALPGHAKGIFPGMFVRAHLAAKGRGDTPRISIPSRALFRRSEITAVYVLEPDGKPRLRLVRVGKSTAERTEIVAGLAPEERVVLDPLAAIPQH